MSFYVVISSQPSETEKHHILISKIEHRKGVTTTGTLFSHSVAAGYAFWLMFVRVF